MSATRVFFYGRLASATRRDAERAARDAGYKIASALREGVDLVVLGEEEPLALTRAKLAADFDDASRDAFERGDLEVLAESEFFRRARRQVALELADSTPGDQTAQVSPSPSSASNASQGYTPAAVAELVGVSIMSIRRWNRRGFLTATYERERLPLFSTREILVARRMAFLCSTGLTEEFVARRLVAFAELERTRNAENESSVELPLFRSLESTEPEPQDATADAPSAESGNEFDRLRNGGFDVGTLVLKTTLSTDGRELLYLSDVGPLDWRGQRRFDFSAFPTDGSFEKPEAPQFLSDDEEQFALAERLAAWNAAATNASGKPAFLTLFQTDAEPTAPEETPSLPEGSEALSSQSNYSDKLSVKSNAERTAREQALDVAAYDLALTPSVERKLRRDALKRRVVELCESAWKLERDGYWEEAARLYRAAASAGGGEPSVCFRLGRALYLLGDYSAARERFYAALEMDDDYVDARVELGKTLVALGELDDALRAFNAALEDRPNDPALRVELGKLYLTLGRNDDAEREFRVAVTKIDDLKLADDVRRLLLTLVRRAR